MEVETTVTHPSTMRRVVVDADGPRVETADVPTPDRDEALVRGVLAGVCGSDVHAAHGRHPFVSLPYLPGHECVGVVAEVGERVTSVAVGQRVTVEPPLPCWNCKMCRSGRENLCEHLAFFGCVHDQGGMAEYYSVRADRLHVVPDQLDDRTAALIEPLSTCVHAVRLAGGVAGKSVAILGAGTIGLLTLAVVRAHGAKRVVVSDVLTSKRERAAELGADAVVDASEHGAAGGLRGALGESADVVFDCVAIQTTLRQAILLADKGGTVCVVGVPATDVTVPLAIIQDHQIRIQGCATYVAEDVERSIELLSQGKVDVGRVVTAEFDLDDVAEAFRRSASGTDVKVLIAIR